MLQTRWLRDLRIQAMAAMLACLALGVVPAFVGCGSSSTDVATGDTSAEQNQTNEQNQTVDTDVDQNVTVNTNTEDPTAIIVAPESAQRGSSVSLDGSSSLPGAGGGSLNYSWAQVTNITGVSLQNAASQTATLKVPLDAADGTQVVIRLTVFAGGRSNDTLVTITISGGQQVSTEDVSLGDDSGDDQPDQCEVDADCNDDLFCNGEEICDDGRCRRQPSPCDADTEECDEDTDQCIIEDEIECEIDEDCDDGEFCNGFEWCSEDGFCMDDESPCAEDEICDEDLEECLDLEGDNGTLLEDQCANAFPVCTGFFYNGTTDGATVDGVDFCGGTGGDVWLTYIPLQDGTLNISMCGSDFDTVISVHTACSSDGTWHIGCDDDGGESICPGENAAAGSIPVTAFYQYWIRVSGYGGETGDFRIELSGPTCLDPDEF